MPVTVVLAGPNRVLQCKTKETDGYNAVQLGFGNQKLQRLTRGLAGHLAKHGAIPAKKSGKLQAGRPDPKTPSAGPVQAGTDAQSKGVGDQGAIPTETPASAASAESSSGKGNETALAPGVSGGSVEVEMGPKNELVGVMRIREFRDFPIAVKPGDLLGPGSPGMFAAGDFVDAIGITKGRGFEGVVKRHGFRGGDLSHGSKGWHRRPGAIGQRLFPGTVRRGLRMPGHMGQVRRTVQNLEVVQVIPEDHLLLIKGAIPGAKGDYVVIREAKKRSKQFMQAMHDRKAKAAKEAKGKGGAKAGK